MKGRTWAFGIYFSADWRSLPAGVNYMVYAHRPMRETTGTFGLIHFVESVRYNKVKAALGVVFEDDLEAETVRACHIEDKENFILGFEDGRTRGRTLFSGLVPVVVQLSSSSLLLGVWSLRLSNPNRRT